MASYPPAPLGNVAMSISELLANDMDWMKLSKDPHAETVRKVLRCIVDTTDVHSDYMKNINSAMNTMRNKLALKFSKEDVDELMNVRNKNGGQSQDKLRKDFDDLRLQVVDLQADMERKPSIRYVDDNLRRKIDRTDSVIQTLTNITAPQNNKEIMNITAEMNQMKAKYEVLSKAFSDLQAEGREKAKDCDVRNIQGQINELYAEIAACPHRKEMEILMSAKIAALKGDYSGNSISSINNAQLIGQVNRLEALVGDHEGIINQLKEIENQENLDSYANTTAASRGVSLKGGRVGGAATLPIIHGSRFSTIMKKISDVEQMAKDCKHDHKELSSKVSIIDKEMATKVSQSDFDVLSDILVDHQSRVDGVVKTFEQVDLTAFAEQLDNVLDFLNLPQDKSYGAKVDEIESSLDHLDNRVRELARKQKEQQQMASPLPSPPSTSRRMLSRRASATATSPTYIRVAASSPPMPRRPSVASPRRASVASKDPRRRSVGSPPAARSSSSGTAAPARRTSAAASPTFSDESPVSRRRSTIKPVKRVSVAVPRGTSQVRAEEEEEEQMLRDSFIGKVWGRSGKHGSSASAASVRRRSTIGSGGVERRTSLDSNGSPQQFVPFVDKQSASGRRVQEDELIDLDEYAEDTFDQSFASASPTTSMGKRRASQSSAPRRSSLASRRASVRAHKEQQPARRASNIAPRVTVKVPVRRASAPVIARSSGYGQTEKQRKHSVVCGLCYARGVQSKISAHHLHAAHGVSYR